MKMSNEINANYINISVYTKSTKPNRKLFYAHVHHQYYVHVNVTVIVSVDGALESMYALFVSLRTGGSSLKFCVMSVRFSDFLHRAYIIHCEK